MMITYASRSLPKSSVVFPSLGIPREHVEPDAAPLKALDRILGLRLDDLQVLLAEDDPQHQLDALRRVLEALRHEGVVHKPEVLDQGKVLRIHGMRRASRRLVGGGLTRVPRSALNLSCHVVSLLAVQGHPVPERRALYSIQSLHVKGRSNGLGRDCLRTRARAGRQSEAEESTGVSRRVRRLSLQAA